MSQGAPVIHICGWPGAGKHTIAKALAPRINGRVLDNHLMLDPASALFDRGDMHHKAMRAEIREIIYRYAENLPMDVPLVVTDALADTAADHALFAPTQALAAARRARLLPVTLSLAAEENIRRLTDPSRAGRSKLMQAEVLTQLRQENNLLQAEGAVVVDVTALSAERAASKIVQCLGLEALDRNA